MPQEFTSSPKSASFKNLKIGVLAGGTSSERQISLRSGKAVFKALKASGCSVRFLDPARKDFQVRLNGIDVAFIALHGHGGEDGVMQSILEKKRIPYIGSDASASRIAFDKILSKKVFIRKRIPTAPFILFNRKNWKSRLEKFPKPCFVKPVREGSSIGAFAVEDLRQSADKIRKTAGLYGDLMAEPKINGGEFTVGVLGNRALPVVEMRPKRAFYDFRAKYTKGMTDYIVPAKISGKLAKRLQKIAVRVHKALKLRDFSRVDMMVDTQTEKVYVLEANSIPGFTELSLLPKAAKADGISFEKLCLRLLDWAVKRKTKGR